MPAPGRVVFVSSATHDPAERTGFPFPDHTTADELAHPRDRDGESPLRTGQRRYAPGRYVSSGRETRSSERSYDPDLARDLWDTSVALTSAQTDVGRC